MSFLSIALVRQRYVADGGAERFVARLLDAVHGSDARVTLITRQWAPTAGVDVSTVNPFSLGRTWRDRSFARAVCRLLAHRRFDLVQSHERVACCDIYRAGDGVHREWLAQRARALGPLGRLSLALNPYHRYTLRAERRLFESARLRAVICNSKMVRAEIQKYFRVPEDRLHVIYNGIDTNDFHPNLRRHRAEVRARYRIPDDATLFLFVGSGFERKGLAAALSALAGVPGAHLLVVGREKRLARFRAQARALGIQGRVHFAGVQPDVRPYYGAADAFILPTLYDPFPNVVLEAMASGLPVVTSTKCGAAELIRDGANGYVVDALDIAALRQSMTRLQASELRVSMGAAARQTVETLDFPRMAKELLTLYRACLAK